MDRKPTPKRTEVLERTALAADIETHNDDSPLIRDLLAMLRTNPWDAR